ncbi:MAG: transcriptional regulator domain protein, partial [Bryobacterales bacterium]|nr:transcriptional regulator domain protein [Bryobacterales bacterium]
AEAWHLKGLFLALRRRVTEAEDSFKRAIEFDPLCLVIQTHTALVPYFAGELGDAEWRVEAALALESHFAEAHWVLGYIHERQERYREAIESLQTAVRFGGEHPTILADIAFLHACLGDFECAREIVARLETGSPRPHPAASSLARVYLRLGERETSNAWLEEGFEARDVMLPWACVDPRYESMWMLPALSGLRQRILGTAAR